jgi:hypothetical protein
MNKISKQSRKIVIWRQSYCLSQFFNETVELLNASHDIPSLGKRQTQFELAHKAWLAEQNQRFETHGVWCDDLRTW